MGRPKGEPKLTEIKAVPIPPEGWLTVPGFSHYRVNPDNGRVWSDVRGKGKVLAIPMAAYYLRPDEGEAVRCYPPRLLFAALRSIDPRKIAGDLLVFSDDSGVPKMTSRSERALEMTRRKMTAGDPKRARREYEEQINFSQMVLRAFDSGDWGDVVLRMEECKGRCMEVMGKCGYFTAEEREDIWAEASQMCLDVIKSGRRTIGCPAEYLCTLTKWQCRRRKDERRRTRQLLNDRLYGRAAL